MALVVCAGCDAGGWLAPPDGALVAGLLQAATTIAAVATSDVRDLRIRFLQRTGPTRGREPRDAARAAVGVTRSRGRAPGPSASEEGVAHLRHGVGLGPE